MNSDWFATTQGLCIDGVNSGVRPDLIGPNQIAWGYNMTVRDGKPRTRCQFRQRLVLPSGRVQGAGFFSKGGGMGILSIGGDLHRILVSGNEFASEEIELSFPNSSILPTAWMVETKGNFLIQDGQSDCIIYDGADARRANPSMQEVPIGRMMAYVNGRLFVAVASNNVVAGDITDGRIPNSELFFTETTYLFGGGAFYYAFEVTGLAGLPTNNTSSGYGSLMVFGKRVTDSLRAEVTDRDLWQIIPGFQLIVLDGIGTPSHLSITRVNQDLYWRDVDGQVRSLRSAAADQNGPGNAPLSREVSRITDFETDSKLEQSCGMYFDNRLFFTAAPFLNAGVTVFGKLISLDLAPLANMRGKAPPAYDGEWTGMNFVRMFKGNFDGKERGFVISSDDDGTNRLWEIVPEAREDVILISSDPVPVSIEAFAEYRRFDFGDPAKYKQLTRCDIYPTQIEGEVSMKLQWRPDSSTQWIDCDEVEMCATMEDNSTAEPHVWKNLLSQERGRIKSYTFPASINPMTLLDNRNGFSFQIRLVWTGNVLIDRIDVWARPLSNPQYSNIGQLPEGCIENNVQDNEIVYSVFSADRERVTDNGYVRVTEDGRIRVIA